MDNNSIKKTLKSLTWSIVAITTAGAICDPAKRNTNTSSSSTRNLVGSRGLWNDFAHYAISSGNAVKKAKAKFKV